MRKRFGLLAYPIGILFLHSLMVGGESLHAQGVSFIARRDFVVGASPFSVAVGDFDGDGKQDLAVANFSSNNISVLINNTPSP